MTTRKGPNPAVEHAGSQTARRSGLIVLLAAFLAGCSTPGPLHLYSVGPRPAVVHDLAVASDPARDVPAFVGESERVVGFAYDPFTDHLFLRLAPGDRIRVVDRPARKIKREFALVGATSDSGDMAVRPRDGHLFVVDGTKAELLETTRLGAFVRRLALGGLSDTPAAVAVDMRSEELLVLARDGRTVRRYGAEGRFLGQCSLARPVEPCLGFDADQQQLYAPLSGSPSRVGVFNASGQLVKTVTIAPGDTLLDAGPHSFFRMF